MITPTTSNNTPDISFDQVLRHASTFWFLYALVPFWVCCVIIGAFCHATQLQLAGANLNPVPTLADWLIGGSVAVLIGSFIIMLFASMVILGTDEDRGSPQPSLAVVNLTVRRWFFYGGLVLWVAIAVVLFLGGRAYYRVNLPLAQHAIAVSHADDVRFDAVNALALQAGIANETYDNNRFYQCLYNFPTTTDFESSSSFAPRAVLGCANSTNALPTNGYSGSVLSGVTLQANAARYILTHYPHTPHGKLTVVPALRNYHEAIALLATTLPQAKSNLVQQSVLREVTACASDRLQAGSNYNIATNLTACLLQLRPQVDAAHQAVLDSVYHQLSAYN